MDKVAPELLKKIESDFDKAIRNDRELNKIEKKIKGSTATYLEANDYAVHVGNILADVFEKNLSSNVFNDGRMHYNIARYILDSALENNYNLISDITNHVQQTLNENAHIGIKSITPELNRDRIDGIVNRMSSADNFDDVKWLLDEPVVNFSQSIVDDFIRVNAEFHAKCGLKPKIVRELAGGCCDWCKALAGEYTYPDNVPKDVYRRHQRCRCTVNYNPADGKVQNIWTKKWKNGKESVKIETPKAKEERIKQENGLELVERIASHPKMLQAYTPQGLKTALERSGCEVKCLGRGKYKNIPFEQGGGFKANFGGDGILQYHPEKGSHHGGAYYKISTGKGGTHHYELDGTEK